MDTLRDGTFQLANTNKLIRFYDGATGLKTGSTDSAKYCLSATAEREGMELIAVVLKSPTGQQRFEDAKALLNYGFSTYALLHTAPEEPFPAIPVVLGETETVQPCIDPQEAVALVQKSQAGGLSQSVTLAEQVEAPVSTGQELGTLTVTDAAGETVRRAWSVSPSVPCCAGCCRRHFLPAESRFWVGFLLYSTGKRCMINQIVQRRHLI